MDYGVEWPEDGQDSGRRLADHTLMMLPFQPADAKDILGLVTDSVVALDADWRLVYVNSRAEELLGRPRAQLVGRPLSELRPDLAGSQYERELRQALETGENRRFESRSPISGQTYRVQAIPQDGLLWVTAVDISVQRKTEEAFRLIASRARCIFWTAYVEERGWQYCHWTTKLLDEEAAQRFLPLRVPDGETYLRVWYRSQLAEDRVARDDAANEAVRAGRPYQTDFRCAQADGQIRWLHEDVEVEPLSPGTWRVVGVCTDVTEQRAQEQELRTAEERLRIALTAGKCGVWDWDIQNDRVTWSEHLYEFHGLRPGEFDGTVQGFLRVIHPEDLASVQEAVSRAVETGHSYHLEFRTLTPSGVLKWLSTDGQVFYDAQGHPLRMMGATTDITERIRYEQALREADRRKDEFLAMLAHELRNPLAPIITAVEVLNEIGSPHPLAARQRQIISRQVGNMARLLEDLLDVSRITRGKITLDAARLDLREIVEDSVESLTPAVSAKEQALSLSLTPQPLWVQGDATRLEQVVTNLLSNAARYTPDQGSISVTLETEPVEGATQALLTVKDTGRGIPPEQLASVFDLFTQLEPSLARSQGGLGIGLTMVRDLVHLHRGTVEAFSEGLGQGAEFRVRLPLAPPAEAE